jgi:hypothetical protein
MMLRLDGLSGEIGLVCDRVARTATGRYAERPDSIRGAMKRFGTALAVMCLTGCGPTIYEKPGASTQEFKAASYACERDLRQSYVGPFEQAGFVERCMNAKGWVAQKTPPATPISAPAQSPLMRDSGSFGQCELASGAIVNETKAKCESFDGRWLR